MEKQKYPEVRFNGFNNQWNPTKLGNACLVTMGQSPNGANYSDCQLDHILVQGNADLKNGHVLPRVYTSQITKKANKGDIILTVRAPVGATAITDYDVVLGRGVAAIKGNRFIYYTLQLIDQLGIWERHSSGSTFDSISSSDIKNLDFFNTDCEEQDSIGDFFQNLEQSIALHEKKLAQTQNFKKAMLEKMFPKQGRNRPEIRLNGFREDWEKYGLFDVAFYKNGKSHEADVVAKGKYIIVNSKFVSTDGIVRKFCNRQFEPLDKGDIVFVLSDVPNGKALAKAFLIDKNQKFTLNQRIAGLTPKNGIDSYFLYILINRNDYFLKFDDGVGQTNLSLADMENFVALYPPVIEQRAIGQFFEKLDETLKLQQQQLQTVKNLKQALLEKMFV